MKVQKKKVKPASKVQRKPKFSKKAKKSEDTAGDGTEVVKTFDDNSDDDDGDEKFSGKNFAVQMVEMNRKNKKSGGFQSMGLGHEIFRGIIKKGYKVPTPIQRKTIPKIMEGLDVVAMARTGSAKTAAFLIPLFHKLIYSSSKGIGADGGGKGARALILSPTRELALQVPLNVFLYYYRCLGSTG